MRRYDRASRLRRHRLVRKRSRQPSRGLQIVIKDGCLALTAVLLAVFFRRIILQPPDQGELALLAPMVAVVVVISLLADGSLWRT
jgi:hypothetical protein